MQRVRNHRENRMKNVEGSGTKHRGDETEEGQEGAEEKGEKWGAREEMFESWQLTRIGSVELYLYDSLASHSARQ